MLRLQASVGFVNALRKTMIGYSSRIATDLMPSLTAGGYVQRSADGNRDDMTRWDVADGGTVDGVVVQSAPASEWALQGRRRAAPRSVAEAGSRSGYDGVTETVPVRFEVLGVERLVGAGPVIALADVLVEVAGVTFTLQGLRLVRTNGGGAVEAPQFRYPQDGRYLPACSCHPSCAMPSDARCWKRQRGGQDRRPTVAWLRRPLLTGASCPARRRAARRTRRPARDASGPGACPARSRSSPGSSARPCPGGRAASGAACTGFPSLAARLAPPASFSDDTTLLRQTRCCRGTGEKGRGVASPAW